MSAIATHLPRYSGAHPAVVPALAGVAFLALFLLAEALGVPAPDFVTQDAPVIEEWHGNSGSFRAFR